MRYWSTLPHATLEETERWVAAMVDAPPDRADDYVIEHQGRVIGKAGCHSLPEIGFILHPEHWGRGLAREAVEAAIGTIMARHAIAALVADVDPRNAASLALLLRLGFRQTGRAARTILVGDAWCDSVYLSRPRPAPAA